MSFTRIITSVHLKISQTPTKTPSPFPKVIKVFEAPRFLVPVFR